MARRADDLVHAALYMADATADFGMLAGAAGKLRDFGVGDVIFKQGDTGQELFIIKSGKIEIRIGNHVLDTLSPGNIFGEMALIDSAPRNATAVAITDATLIAVSQKQFVLSTSNLAFSIMRDMSQRLRKRARETELMNIDAITASIVHEIKQPLSAISANSSAARRFLGKTPPNVQEARGCLIRIVDGVRKTSEMLDGTRSLFRRADQVWEQIDVSEITFEVLKPMGAELKNHRITTLSELTKGAPLVDGNKMQLQKVIVNLVRNAMEAMADTTDRNRLLRVKTEQRSGDAIVLSVQDTGPGIDPKDLESIFDAFVTTKSGGMGWICHFPHDRRATWRPAYCIVGWHKRGRVSVGSAGRRNPQDPLCEIGPIDPKHICREHRVVLIIEEQRRREGTRSTTEGSNVRFHPKEAVELPAGPRQ
jgi:signal transduction histidine kinase